MPDSDTCIIDIITNRNKNYNQSSNCNHISSLGIYMK